MRHGLDFISVPGLRAVAAALSCLALWGCATPVAPVGRATDAALEGRRWSLVALQGEALAPQRALPSVPHVVLRAGRLTGRGGCNGISAPYERDGSTLRFGRGVSTMMACPDTMALEQRFLSVFDRVASWRPAGDGIEWLDADGQVLASFSESIGAWRCDDGNTVLVRYEQSQGQKSGLTLSLAGREYAMWSVPSASGARYAIEQGRRTDWSMEWHEKGGEAMLLEAPLSDDRKPEDLAVFARCRAE